MMELSCNHSPVLSVGVPYLVRGCTPILFGGTLPSGQLSTNSNWYFTACYISKTPSHVSYFIGVDETVINIIGYFKPNTPSGETKPDELFAIDWTKRALLVSEDGVTFKSCNPDR